MRAIFTIAVTFGLMVGLVEGCNSVPGEVTGRDSDCHATRHDIPDPPQLCTYQLKTSKGWFEVGKTAYQRCDVGEQYPRCGDKK